MNPARAKEAQDLQAIRDAEIVGALQVWESQEKAQRLQSLLSDLIELGFSEMVTASDGVLLPISSLAKSYAYVDGVLTSITVVYDGKTYVKTLTYDANGNLTSSGVSGQKEWVKQ